jgi:acetyltransferase-like isoleucine patch superfamily enzyme
VKPVQRAVRKIAMRTGKLNRLYLRICNPGGEEWAAYLKAHGGLAGLGEGCSILATTNITDPELTYIGNNVHTSTCALIAHDGAVAMFARAYGTRVDAVSKIVIKDNVFIGYQAIVLGNVTVGTNCIVAAGAVVVKDVADGDIVAGVPARPIGRVKDYIEKLRERTASYPWADLIYAREGGFDPQIEPLLQDMRRRYFFPELTSNKIEEQRR